MVRQKRGEGGVLPPTFRIKNLRGLRHSADPLEPAGPPPQTPQNLDFWASYGPGTLKIEFSTPKLVYIQILKVLGEKKKL